MYFLNETIEEECGNDKNLFISLINKEDFEFLIESKLNENFSKELYKLIINIFLQLKKDNKLIDEFFYLRSVYNFFFYNSDYLKEVNILEFFKKINKN
jgi:hypothetical protein